MLFQSSDNGGNLFNILFNQEVKELHALWDSGIGNLQEELERPLTSEGWHKVNMWAEWCMGNNTIESLAE